MTTMTTGTTVVVPCGDDAEIRMRGRLFQVGHRNGETGEWLPIDSLPAIVRVLSNIQAEPDYYIWRTSESRQAEVLAVLETAGERGLMPREVAEQLTGYSEHDVVDVFRDLFHQERAEIVRSANGHPLYARIVGDAPAEEGRASK